MRGHGNLRLKFLLKFFFALNIPAKQARQLREKLRGKLCEKLRPELPPSETETSPKTSLFRNPLLSLNIDRNRQTYTEEAAQIPISIARHDAHRRGPNTQTRKSGYRGGGGREEAAGPNYPPS